jgi:NDP-sugar pyrophosphorylase family protein
MTMLLFHAPNPKACGIAELDGDGRIIGFEEKPATPTSDLANAGVYAVSADAWREIAAMQAFDLGFDVLPRFVGRMRGYAHNGYHRDIGNHAALAAACREAPALFMQDDRLKKGSEK